MYREDQKVNKGVVAIVIIVLIIASVLIIKQGNNIREQGYEIGHEQGFERGYRQALDDDPATIRDQLEYFRTRNELREAFVPEDHSR